MASRRGTQLLELVAVMDRLRSPGGCPWDAEQTHHSLVEYLIEEAYETVEAIDTEDADALREELGDLLLQVVFHSRIAQESVDEAWDIDDVARGITDKLIKRHPHVFGSGSAESAADVEAQWQARKAAEKGRSSAIDGVPTAMPAIVQAAKLARRARHGGVEVDAVPELAVTAEALLDEHDLGALLIELVTRAEVRGVDADAELRRAVLKFRDTIQSAESTG